MIVASVDAGLDDVRLAVWDTAKAKHEPLTPTIGALKGWVSNHKFKTSPQDTTSDRCAQIAEWVEAVVSKERVELVWLEVPSAAGAYARMQAKQQTKTAVNAAGIEKLNRSIGAIAAGIHAGGARIEEVKSKTSKEHRKIQVQAALDFLKMEPVRNADAIDALWLGVEAINRLHTAPLEKALMERLKGREPHPIFKRPTKKLTSAITKKPLM